MRPTCLPALFIAAVHYGRLNEQIVRAKIDRFDLDAKRASTADTFYNGLPGLLHQDYRLKRADGSLWKMVRLFYESVRNPLFHGSQLAANGLKYLEMLDAVLQAYEMFVGVYEWIDWWCPRSFVMGANAAGAVPISEMPILPMAKHRADIVHEEEPRVEPNHFDS